MHIALKTILRILQIIVPDDRSDSTAIKRAAFLRNFSSKAKLPNQKMRSSFRLLSQAQPKTAETEDAHFREKEKKPAPFTGSRF